MDFISNAVRSQAAFLPLIQSLQMEKKPVAVSGVCEGLRHLLLEQIAVSAARPLVVFVPDEAAAKHLYAQMNRGALRVLLYPVRDWSFTGFDAASGDFISQRLGVLCALLQKEADVVITCVEAACQHTLPKKVLSETLLPLRRYDDIPPEELTQRLVATGYQFCEKVEGKGQISRRGGILDVFCPTRDQPLRLEFFGDTLDRLSVFDPITQRSTEEKEEVLLTPADEFFFSPKARQAVMEALHQEEKKAKSPEKKELLCDQLERLEQGRSCAADCYLFLTGHRECLLDYCTHGVFAIWESSLCQERHVLAQELLKETVKSLCEQEKLPLVPQVLPLWEFSLLLDLLRESPCVCLESFAGRGLIPPAGTFCFSSRTAPDHGGSYEVLLDILRGYLGEGRRVFYAAANSLAADTLRNRLTEDGIKAHWMDSCASGEDAEEKHVYIYRQTSDFYTLSSGFELPESKAVFLSDLSKGKGETGRLQKAFPVKKSARETIVSYADLEPGDYVVHAGYGIGLYEGIEKIPKDGALRDFIKIRYAGTDVLYVPCSNLENISKYIGAGSDASGLKLSKMGSEQWHKTKSRAKQAAKDIAKELIALYAQRNSRKGHAFAPDSPWQKEFEDAFEYVATEDQLRAAQEIKRDMEKPVPMDRLLCGDVGFGKTEIALRAVFKCIMDGKQAAILVPTTLLAWQHYQTVLRRFRGYPVKVGLLNRFCTPKEVKRTLEDLKNGAVDIVVGTHRLLQNDVAFYSLGLLVVDEEQRFGVSHKEKIKQQAQTVDVLTLTATPIPRTLNMALGGIRDMSVLEEAPGDRFPVQTYVTEYDPSLLLEAVRKELRRGGQVFWLHNHTEELSSRGALIASAFPEARVATAHGKMEKTQLNRVWKDMMDHRLDVLVCTTIIETGVDVTNANTLIVEHADRFGLAQLHQIRGRVGRSDRKAYAFFTYRKGRELTEIAQKRLKAIREYTQFGAGFKLALRDLELRGAGNLLGAQQHGHLDSVGYDLFMQLLDRAVKEEKGALPEEEKKDCTVDLAVDAFLPSDYVSSSRQRIDCYKSISAARSEEEVVEAEKELSDRFGTHPLAVKNLFAIARLKLAAMAVGVEKVSQQENRLIFFCSEPDLEALSLLHDVYTTRFAIHLAGKPRFTLEMTSPDPLGQSLEILYHYGQFSRKKV